MFLAVLALMVVPSLGAQGVEVAIRRLGAKPDKIIVDVQAASPNS